MKNRKWIIPAGCLLLLVCLGTIWQKREEKRDAERFSVQEQYADLGSYRAAYALEGDGPLSFVLIEGSGTPDSYTDFSGLREALAPYGKVLSFDRAGTGYSTKTTVPRTLEHLTKELNTLVEAVLPEEKLILICHSLGGLEGIGYALAFPERVAGLIFLDCGSPEFYAKDSELSALLLNRLTGFLRSSGVIRALGRSGILLPLYGEKERQAALPPALKERDLALYFAQSGNPEVRAYVSRMNENARELLTGGKLGTPPILVLSSDSGESWSRVQQELAAWSENSRQLTIPGSTHYLHWSGREAVIRAIEEYLEAEFGIH